MFNIKHRHLEHEFLPAALEIMETPPHPLAHWISRTLMALFTFAVLWACFGKVNIVATAEGKIMPSSRVKQIQPLEKGVVKSILVKEGDRVAEGQPLVELDRTLTASDQQRFTSELDDAKAEMDRLQKFQAMIVGAPLAAPDMYAHVGAPLVGAQKNIQGQIPTGHPQGLPLQNTLQDQLLQQQWNQYLAQRAASEGELAKRKAEQKSNIELIKKLQGTLPLITKRVNAVKGLMEKKMVPETQYLELEEQRITQEQDLAVYQANQQQLNAAIQQAEQQLNALVAQTQSETLAKISDTQQQMNALQESLNKATDMNARQILYAPVSGQVQGLAINTIGGVVTEAQQLMMIVPEGENFEVEVYLQNKDIGFVHKGDSAEIKVHTFPFTKYGVINATVSRISDDAFSISQGDRINSVPSRESVPSDGLVYTMGLQMEKGTIRVNDKDVRLMPGMAVTAEVKTGERRMIEFFLAPLLKAKQESIRER